MKNWLKELGKKLVNVALGDVVEKIMTKIRGKQ